MKPKLILHVLSLVALLTTSCAYHKGMMTGSASLQSKDFELIDIGFGKASAMKVLGIGGFKQDALVLDAKQDMYKKYPLKKGQSYANITVDFKYSYFIIINRTDVIISADIVQFSGSSSQDSLQRLFKKSDKLTSKLTPPAKNNYTEDFIGDSVYFNKDNELLLSKIIISTKFNEFFFIKLPEDTKASGVLKLSREEVYFINKPMGEKYNISFDIGQKVNFKEDEETVTGEIIALGFSKALIKRNESKEMTIMPYTQLVQTE